MSNEKYFEFHWKDGKTEYIKGFSVADAARKGGIGQGAISVLDYHSEAKSLPLEKKEVWFVSKAAGSSQMVEGAMFVNQLREQISDGIKDVTIKIANRVWNCSVRATAFRLIVTEK